MKKVKMFKIDKNGEHWLWEFGDFLKIQRIVHQTFISYTSQQNGFVQRINHTIIKATCCIMHQQPKVKFKILGRNYQHSNRHQSLKFSKVFQSKDPKRGMWQEKTFNHTFMCF
jgi:hypothetical protein